MKPKRSLLRSLEFFAISFFSAWVLIYWVQINRDVAIVGGLCAGAFWIIWKKVEAALDPAIGPRLKAVKSEDMPESLGKPDVAPHGAESQVPVGLPDLTSIYDSLEYASSDSTSIHSDLSTIHDRLDTIDEHLEMLWELIREPAELREMWYDSAAAKILTTGLLEGEIHKGTTAKELSEHLKYLKPPPSVGDRFGIFPPVVLLAALAEGGHDKQKSTYGALFCDRLWASPTPANPSGFFTLRLTFRTADQALLEWKVEYSGTNPILAERARNLIQLCHEQPEPELKVAGESANQASPKS